MSDARALFVHVDMDSPSTLLRYYGRGEASPAAQERFYEAAAARALRLFERCGVKATFFCVGSELGTCAAARDMVVRASGQGHEIANHTWSHPFGITRLPKDAMRAEIEECSAAIADITGTRPAGFRSPGYDMSTDVIQVLEDLGFAYDSTAFWSSLTTLIKTYHRLRTGDRGVYSGFAATSRQLPRDPYFPAPDDWTSRGPRRAIMELPLPRTRLFGLPFYGNFHLTTPQPYPKLAVARMRQPHVVYLLHLVEFVELEDGLPAELGVHPNVRAGVARKLARVEAVLGQLIRRGYAPARADEYVATLQGRREPSGADR